MSTNTKETPCFSFLVAGPEVNINNKKSIQNGKKRN